MLSSQWFRKGTCYKHSIGPDMHRFFTFRNCDRYLKRCEFSARTTVEIGVLKLPALAHHVHPTSGATDGSWVHLFAVSNSPTGLKGFGAAPLLKSHEVSDMTHMELQG